MLLCYGLLAWVFGIPTGENYVLIAGLTGSAIVLHNSFEGVNGIEWIKVVCGVGISVTLGDREDLDMLSHTLDNVPDEIEDILQKLYINNIKTINTTAIEFAKCIVRACEHLCEIMEEFENLKSLKKFSLLLSILMILMMIVISSILNQ